MFFMHNQSQTDHTLLRPILFLHNPTLIATAHEKRFSERHHHLWDSSWEKRKEEEASLTDRGVGVFSIMSNYSKFGYVFTLWIGYTTQR